MEQARIRNSVSSQNRAWPATVRAAKEFHPKNGQYPGFEVFYLDYAIFTILRLANIEERAFTVRGLVVNGEFCPTFAVAYGQFSCFWLPFEVNCNSALNAVIQAPITRVPVSSCYPKMPESLVVSTNCGDIAFQAREIMCPGGRATIQRDKFCAGL